MQPTLSCPPRSDYERLIHGELSPADVEQLSQHLAGCSSCAAVVQTLVSGDTLLSALRGAAVDVPNNANVPADLTQRLLALIAQTSGERGCVSAPSLTSFLAPAQAADEIGRLAYYRVLKVLGEGGMGVVFLAEDTRLGRTVALKTMKPTIAADPRHRQRFLREARAAAKVEHDHIVPIYDVGEDNGVPWLAMPLLKGESLDELLKRRKVLKPAQAVRLGVQVAKGLAAAHAAGLIHRDVKPANIWVEPEHGGRAKLLDFGLARADRPDQEGEEHLTRTGAVAGTPAFMAPEQADGQTLDARADLFSLGCVLYRMVTGRLPFQGQGMMGTLRALATETPPAPHEVEPAVPQPLSALIMTLLAKERSARPESAAAVVKKLEALQEKTTSQVPMAIPVRSAAPPIPKDDLDAAEPVHLLPPLPRHAPTPPRRCRLVPRALAALTLFGMTALAAGIIIRIRGKDGRETIIKAPEGSKVSIEHKGKVVVFPADAPNPSRDRQGAEQDRESERAVVPPLAEGTEPLGPWALVQRPARLKGVRSWTIETRSLRGGAVSCAMRLDGRQLAVGSQDGVIRLYDPNTGRLQQALFGQTKAGFGGSLAGHHLTWSPDGKRLASSYGDGTLHIWNAATGQILRTIHPSGSLRCVDWSPDGKLLAAGADAGVSFWDAETGQQVPFSVQARNVISLEWSPVSKLLAAASQDNMVRLWEVPTGKLLHNFEAWVGAGQPLAFSQDGNTLVLRATSANELRLWDVHSGKLLRTLELQAHLNTAAFSPDGKSLAVGAGGPGFVQFYDSGSWKPLNKVWTRSQEHTNCLAWFPDGTTLAAACYKGHVSIFDVKTGKEMRRIERHPLISSFLMCGPAWSADSKKIAMPGYGDGVCIWDTNSGEQLRRIEAGYVFSTVWSPRGTSLAVNDAGNGVHILDGDSGQRLRSWNAPLRQDVAPFWSPDGKLIATAATDKTVQVWAAASGRLVHTLKGHTAYLNAIAWSPDGKLIASGSAEDKTVRLWDVSSGKQIHAFDADSCLCLAWSPDGKSLASGTFGNTWTWDITTKELQVRCAGRLLGWSADSEAVATWEESGPVRWWDRQTGELLRHVEFPFLSSWPIPGPDGRFVAVPRGGALYIGDVSRGKFQRALVPLRNGQWLAVRPDGRYRGSPGVEKEIVYIVQTDAGQEVLSPEEFANKYGGQKPAKDGQKPATDPDRRAAEWVMSVGGTITIRTRQDGQEMEIKAAQDLPAAPFVLVSVNLKDNQKVDDAGLEHLKGLTHLTRLDLSGTEVTDAGLEHLKGMPELTQLDLAGTRVSDAGLQHLKELTKLTDLQLGDTRVSDAGLIHLKGLTNLTGLELAGTRVGDVGLMHLKGLTNLTWLNLNGTEVTDAGLKCLKGLTNLTELMLDGTRVTDAGLQHLKGLAELTVLNLVRTQVSDAGLAHLMWLTNLTELMLDNTRVSDTGLKHIKGLSKLTGLYASGTQVSDAGLVHLKVLNKLKVLWLARTRVSDAGLEHFKDLTNLKSLRLDRTGVSDGGLQHLAGMKKLKYLVLTDTQVTSDGAAALQKALPKCKIVAGVAAK